MPRMEKFFKNPNDFYIMEDYDTTVQHYNQLFLDADFDRANDLYNKSEYDAAIRLYKQLLQRDYNPLKVFPNLINSYLYKQDFEKVIYYLNKYATLKPMDRKSVDALLENILVELPKLSKNQYYLYINKAVVLIQFKHFDDAIKCLDKAIKLNPEDIYPVQLKAILLFDNGDMENSLKLFNQIININERNYVGLKYLGYISLEMDNVKEAIGYFKQALSVNNKDPEIWRQYYFAIAYSGNLNKALEVNNDGLKIFPDNEILWYDRFQLFDSIGDRGNAKDCLKRIEEINPDLFKE
ncbi:tetratricopeptide repeat protein [Methanobrevibacter boviskoreani]|uniref:tetratricopeptide repeat protein n=1 Tax=Methanobrevibacter boviskoreani TaxID=1348249 RepID=UPI0023F47B0A|nr:tetratricopeptide repeat protein [Methanobrevibacter boviskoreani]MDD6257534.1 tetratricopeptide repeat protein [Methanobrevibacter boviskoreani]